MDTETRLAQVQQIEARVLAAWEAFLAARAVAQKETGVEDGPEIEVRVVEEGRVYEKVRATWLRLIRSKL